MAYTLLIHLTVDGHLGSFQCGVVIISAKNILQALGECTGCVSGECLCLGMEQPVVRWARLLLARTAERFPGAGNPISTFPGRSGRQAAPLPP